MHKVIKRVIAGLVTAAVTCGGVYGGFIAYRTTNTEPVKVIPVSTLYEATMEDAWAFNQPSYASGTVRSDRVQSVFLSETLTVKEILAEQGDNVKKGDVLFSYDTTLTEIQLEKAKIDLQKKQRSLEKKQAMLERLKTLSPSSGETDVGGIPDYDEPEETDSVPEEPILYEPEETPVLMSGDGSMEDPYVYLWGTEDPLDSKALLQMFCPDGRKIIIPEKIENQNTTDSSAESIVEDITDTTNDEVPDVLPGPYADEDEQTGQVDADNLDDETPDEQPENTESETDDAEEGNTSETENPDDYIPDDEYTDDDITDTETPHVEDIQDGGDGAEIVDDEYLSDDADSDFTTISFIAPQIRFSENIETLSSDDYPDDDITPDNEYEEGGAAQIYEPEPGKETNDEQINVNDLRTEVYIVLEIHQDNCREAPLLHKHGLHLFRTDDQVAIRFYNPDATQDTETLDPFSDVEAALDEILNDTLADLDDAFSYDEGSSGYEGSEGSAADEGGEEQEETKLDDAVAELLSNEDDFDWKAPYTAEEIRTHIETCEKEILQARLDVKKAEIDLRGKEEEMQNTSVRAKIDGVVETVREPEEAKSSNSAFMVVSGGGGYYATVSFGEFDLSYLTKGTEVDVQSFYTNKTYKGTIETVADYPSTGDFYYSASGNQNVSTYPAEIRLENGAEMQEDEYVEVAFTKKPVSGLLIDRRFIRTEGTSSYVYVANEDGKLKKKDVILGRLIDYTSYIQVKKGLSLKDKIAFPYGNNVYEGAATEEVSLDTMYGYEEY